MLRLVLQENKNIKVVFNIGRGGIFNMEIWVSELQTKDLGLTARVKEVLFMGESDFQEIMVVDTYEYGRMLILDGVYQCSMFDEYVYSEMISNVPLYVHPDPRKVLVVGGADGGTVREVVKHPAVEQVEIVEIDAKVVEVCRKFLPEISTAYNHPKVQLKFADGVAHMAAAQSQYDVIIVDCSDPVGPGEALFSHAFYQDVYKALKPDGLFVQQTESPFFHQSLIKRLVKDVRSLFPIVRTYLAHIPIYPSGAHCFTVGSKLYDPLLVDTSKIPDLPTRYYNRDIQRSSFVLPNFVRDLLKQ